MFSLKQFFIEAKMGPNVHSVVSWAQVETLIDKTREKRLRGIMLNEGDKVIVWDAFMFTHGTVIQENDLEDKYSGTFELAKNWNIKRLYLHFYRVWRNDGGYQARPAKASPRLQKIIDQAKADGWSFSNEE